MRQHTFVPQAKAMTVAAMTDIKRVRLLTVVATILSTIRVFEDDHRNTMAEFRIESQV